jgi:hypothetical protein
LIHFVCDFRLAEKSGAANGCRQNYGKKDAVFPKLLTGYRDTAAPGNILR